MLFNKTPSELSSVFSVELERYEDFVEMSRNSAPSASQLEQLVICLEAKPWLAKGHARSANARIRTRRAWCDITTALNSDGSECVKTADQWCKYWKDKKGAVKRKKSQLIRARQQTGGGNVDLPELNPIEPKILTIMGGDNFAIGDRHLEINPFQGDNGTRNLENEVSPSILLNTPLLHSPEAGVQDYQVQWNQSAIAVLDEGNGQPSLTPITPILQDVSPTQNQEDILVEPLIPTSPGDTYVQSSSVETPSRRTVREETFRNRRRTFQQQPRGTAGRRRLLRRSPPSQRQSEMASLTERFIAIEERRVDTEQISM